MAGNRNVVLGDLNPCWEGDVDVCFLITLDLCVVEAFEDVRESKLLVDFICDTGSLCDDMSDDEWF